jgi:hypothetical protein
MIDRSHALPVVRQAELAGLSRASVYYLPRATSDADQKLMKRIDAIHLEYPFAGARMLRDLLLREGFNVGRRHIGTLMAKMGIEALYRKPNTSRKHPKNKVHPYLLRGLKIERANHVWATDITLYLADVENSVRHTRRGQHGHYVRHRAWDVDEAPRLTFAPYRDRTVAKASPSAMSLY